MSKLKQVRHHNSRSLAIERNLGLFTRARGALHWEENVSEKQRREITQIGNEVALKQYMDGHKCELAAELQRRTEDAQKAVDWLTSVLPMSADDWINWMFRNHDVFPVC